MYTVIWVWIVLSIIKFRIVYWIQTKKRKYGGKAKKKNYIHNFTDTIYIQYGYII